MQGRPRCPAREDKSEDKLYCSVCSVYHGKKFTAPTNTFVLPITACGLADYQHEISEATAHIVRRICAPAVNVKRKATHFVVTLPPDILIDHRTIARIEKECVSRTYEHRIMFPDRPWAPAPSYDRACAIILAFCGEHDLHRPLCIDMYRNQNAMAGHIILDWHVSVVPKEKIGALSAALASISSGAK